MSLSSNDSGMPQAVLPSYILADRRPCSILDALEASSPILAPTVLTATLTSEEVPMFLFDSGSNHDIASRRSSVVSDSHCSDLISSESSDTIQTAQTCSTYGTFGQLRRSRHQSTQVQNFFFAQQTKPVSNHAGDDIDGNPTNTYSPQDSSEDSSSATQTTLVNPEATPLFTPTVSPPSPSPSVYSTLSCSVSTLYGCSDQTQFINYSGYAGDLHSMLDLSAVSLSQCDSVISLPSLVVSRSCHDKKAPASATFAPQTSFPSRPAPAPTPMSLHPELPRTLAWLKDTIVEILIDQEGFRSVTPTFRFAGYSTNPRSLDSSEKVIEGGAAQFVPIARQTFNFHYAPFDGQPILRRISVNGTFRDHVSRQATMCLKSNGVYTVRGSETSIITKGANGDSCTEASKLRWKFDYYVDDRRGSGRREGEKTFTPLTFSCSPLLLHPLQGKKIRLMHVMKKNVVPKLVAEKMELPKATSNRSPTPVFYHTGVTSPPLPRTDPLKAHLWNLHWRFQSQGHSSGHRRSESSGSRVPSPLGIHQVNEIFSTAQQPVSQRHRRVSSAGEIDVKDIIVGQTSASKARHGNPMLVLSPNRLGTPMPPYDRHILPPSKLSELLENIENVKPAVSKVEVFTGLFPAPRHTRALALT